MKKGSNKSIFALKKLMIGAFVAFSVSLIIAGCRTKELNPPERATEFMTSHLNLSDEQTRKIAPLAENLFAEKEELLDIRKTINNEIIAQMKSETADAAELKALLNKNIEQLRLKLTKFSNSFMAFHVILTPEQRSELVEKMERRREHADKGVHRGHWGRRWF
ncbi:MAG: Spy/CpxP family protein refolding chaperone [SAR324 cluster bacterium]|nr:Spy/CpxP family protein refolding chaperone [SAR324 cluster bacterium]